MKRSINCFLGFIAISLVFSCANNEKWNNIHTVKVSCADKEETAIDTSEMEFASPTVTHDIAVNMEFMDTTMMDNAEVCRTINGILFEEFLGQKEQIDAERAVAKFIARLKYDYSLEDKTNEIYDHFTGKAEYGRDNVINYTMLEEFYGGGAHPTMVTTILRFDASTGKKINLYEFFTDTCTQALCDKLTQRLMDYHGAPTLDSLHNLGYLEMQNMFVSDNFLLKKDSVSFFYNQYDIAPYALGTTTISFGYDELEEFIRK